MDSALQKDYEGMRVHLTAELDWLDCCLIELHQFRGRLLLLRPRTPAHRREVRELHCDIEELRTELYAFKGLLHERLAYLELSEPREAQQVRLH